MNIFLIGEKGVGKSTVIKKVMAGFKGKMGGFLTKKSDKTIEFCTLEDEVLFSFDFDDDPTDIGMKFDTFGIEELLESFENSQLIIMDELGFLERKAERFKMAVMNIVKSEKTLIAVLKKYKKNYFYNSLKDLKGNELLDVKMGNRDNIPSRILEILNNEKN